MIETGGSDLRPEPRQALSNALAAAGAPRGAARRRSAATYETVRAVDDISFEIAAGERVGFLGPNGAGKTTTLKMLAGLLHPTSGEAQVDGFDPQKREAEFLAIDHARHRPEAAAPVGPAARSRRSSSIARSTTCRAPSTSRRSTSSSTLLELAPLSNKPTRQLSLGERMKCELAAALLHRPKVLFLDEPTIGLDVDHAGRRSRASSGRTTSATTRRCS